MRTKITTMLALLAAAAALALPATASAHCATPNGWTHLSSDSGAAWVQGWQYGSGQTDWFASNQYVWASRYNADWAYVYGAPWMLMNGAWMQHTGWNWVSTHDLHC